MLNDPICEYCPNKLIKFYTDDAEFDMPCPNLCYPLTWIDGDVSRKERLLKHPEREDRKARENYNDVINKLSKEKSKNHIEQIWAINDITMRAIAAMLWARISIQAISELLQISRQAVYKKMGKYAKNINEV